MTHLRSVLAIAIMTLPLLISCSSPSNRDLPPGATGTVAGRVTFNGEPIPKKSTVVATHEASSLPAAGETAADGTYRLSMKGGSKILAGKYKVSVQPPADLLPGPGEDLKAPDKVPQIPKLYRNLDTSPLSFELASGVKTFDIDLKPPSTDKQPSDK